MPDTWGHALPCLQEADGYRLGMRAPGAPQDHPSRGQAVLVMAALAGRAFRNDAVLRPVDSADQRESSAASDRFAIPGTDLPGADRARTVRKCRARPTNV